MDLYEKLRNLRMFLVEGDPLLRESMILFFRSTGCSVAGFSDAGEAMNALEKEVPDIVISDNFLRGTDGLSLLRRIGEQHPGTLRILITGYPSPVITHEVERAGIDEFILNPFSLEELENALRRLLKNPGGRKTEFTGSV